MCYNEKKQKEAKFWSKTIKFFLLRIIFWNSKIWRWNRQ